LEQKPNLLQLIVQGTNNLFDVSFGIFAVSLVCAPTEALNVLKGLVHPSFRNSDESFSLEVFTILHEILLIIYQSICQAIYSPVSGNFGIASTPAYLTASENTTIWGSSFRTARFFLGVTPY
jgi:hypothetical protein